MFKLARYLKKYKKELIIGPSFKLFEAILELIVPIVMAKIIDKGIAAGNIPYILQMGGIMLLLGIVGLISANICQVLASVASQGFGTNLREEIYKKINSFSHRELDKFGTPTLITRITNDVNQLQHAVAMLIRLFIRAPFLVIGSIIMAMLLDLKLSVIFLVVTPFIAFTIYIVMTKSIPFFKTMQKKLDRISQISRENLQGARVIRAFSKQRTEEERFASAAKEFTETAIKAGKISALLNPITYALINLAIVAIIWFGGIRVNFGTLTQGEIIAFVSYMGQTLLSLIMVSYLIVLFTKASASATRVNEILETESSVTEYTDSIINVPKDESVPKIEFKNVYFSYHQNNKEKNLIENLSFKIRKGQTVGIIGTTGSGKSTIVNLIPRFYDVDAGEILIDGINVKNYSFNQLRGQIGLVPQKAGVISGTVRENMQFKIVDATDNEIYSALETAVFKKYVENLPEKLSTFIARGGKNLSGGQLQRLTIARALVGKPEILILDDSSSALDYATDALLRKNLKEQTDSMTVIIVSQRAAAIKNSDIIIVIENGKILDSGTHNELLNNCLEYREICSSQNIAN